MAKEVIVGLLLLAVFWHIKPSNSEEMILKEEFPEKTEQLISLAMNMVVMQAIQLKTLTDFMIRKVKANINLEQIQPHDSLIPQLAKAKCSKFLKYKPEQFDNVINETTEKAFEFMRSVILLKIETKACKNKELVQSLMCLLTVGNNLNSLYAERHKLIGPLIFKLNQTVSMLTEDYKICSDYIETLPKPVDPFAITEAFVRSEIPHAHLQGCEHVDAFINRETGEISWVSCNETAKAIDDPKYLLSSNDNGKWSLSGQIVNPF
uniref:Putative secreted protein n=1 Tax=Panstrongylus lignarius TaxID=156445 RepID=A0A224XQP4_9HEMI